MIRYTCFLVLGAVALSQQTFCRYPGDPVERQTAEDRLPHPVFNVVNHPQYVGGYLNDIAALPYALGTAAGDLARTWH